VYARYAGVGCFTVVVCVISVSPLFVFEREKCLLLELGSWSYLIVFTVHHVDNALPLFNPGAAGYVAERPEPD
jgi:hypothetical protein